MPLLPRSVLFSDFETLHPRGDRGRFVRPDATSRGDALVNHSGHAYDVDGVSPGGDFDRKVAVSDAGVLAREQLGMDLSLPGVRSLLAAAAGASHSSDRVSFDVLGGGQLRIRVESPGFRSDFLLRRPPKDAGNQGRLVARMQLMRNDSQVSGRPGAEILADVVRSLRRAGASHLFLDAAGGPNDPDGYNGYYTWPRLGCEGEISDSQHARLPSEWKKKLGRSRSVQDLFSMGGGDAWKRHGDHIYCWFDLAENSRNSRNLERYLDSRKENPSADFAWDLNLALFAARRVGGWEAAPKAPGRVRRRTPGNRWEYADAADVAAEIPVAQLAPSGQGSPAPSAATAIPYASVAEDDPRPIGQRISEHARGRRLHAEIFGGARFEKLMAARQRQARHADAVSDMARDGVRELIRRGAEIREDQVPLVERELVRHVRPAAVRDLEEADHDLRIEEERFRAYLYDRLAARRPQSLTPGGMFPTSVRATEGTSKRMAEALGLAGSIAEVLPGEKPIPGPWLNFVPTGEQVGGIEVGGGYDPRYGVVSYPYTGCPTSTMMHELGHHLERHLPGAAEASLAFLEHRRRGEPIQRLNQQREYRGAPDDFVGFRDDFGKVFGHEAIYVGRQYPPTQNLSYFDMQEARQDGYPVIPGKIPQLTEVLAMGLDMLHAKPHRFEKDPEFFSFLVGVLDGSLRDPPALRR